jgi:hypothetical protein
MSVRKGPSGVAAPLLVLALIAGSVLPAQGGSPFRFNLFANYDRQWLTWNRGSLWNPANMFSLPSDSARLFINPEARLAFNNVRVKLSPHLTVDDQGKVTTSLREAFATLAWGAFEVTAGKVLMKLGTGYMFTPISVITPSKALSDPEDTLRGQEGVTMVKADYFRESWSLSAMVFKKDDWRNIALFGYTSWKGLDIYGLLYYPEYRKLEAGLALAATVGQGLEIHAEAMLHRRAPALAHRVFEAMDPRVSYNDWPLVQPEDRLYPELLVGTNATIKDVSVIAEYYHRDWGLDEKAWANLKEYFAFNLARTSTPFSSPDIGSAMTILQAGSRGLGRDYIFARVAKNFGRTDISGIVFINLADLSLMAMADINFELADGIALFIRPLFFTGKPGSEFGSSFYSSMLQIGVIAVL